MFNRDLIAERLAIIQKAVARLGAFASMPLERFAYDEDAIDIAENRLRRALEALFDLGRHLVVKSGLGVPTDYRSVIEKLREGRIIPEEFARQIAGMAGYRNRLIHDYNKVTPSELHDIIRHRLSDFISFCGYVVEYLQRTESRNR